MARRCGAKHISSKNVQNTPPSVLEVGMWKNATPLWRGAYLQVKMHKTPQHRSIFGHWAVENLHAAVARSTFASQNVKNMRCSGPFIEVRMSNNSRKMARRCGAKRICKSNCTKHMHFASFLEVPMSQRYNKLTNKLTN